MADKDKKRDPMPPPDATPEEIGEFWDTHSLADYWDETHEVEFQVNLKSRQDLPPGEDKAAKQSNTLSAEQGWQKLKELIQKMGNQGKDFEKLVAKLLELLLEIPFVLAKSGTQPSGDARSMTGAVSIQAKNYSDRKDPPRDVEIVGDIDTVRRNLQDLQVYVLVISRDVSAQSLGELEAISEETGLDIVTLELSDELSDLGALCITYWEDISNFFNPSDTDQEFSDWIQIASADFKTKERLKQVYLKLEEGIQTQHQVYKDTRKYLHKRFGYDTDHTLRFKYPIDLSKAINRKLLELQITNWWETPGKPVCYLEGEEGMGKSWLAAKLVKSICEDKKIVTFWLDSNTWKNCKSLTDLFEVSLKTIPGYHNERKLTKLKYKIRDLWWPPTLIVLDGVNEEDVIESTKQILDEYFTHGNELEGKIRIRLLLTTRPLHTYRNFQHNMWDACERIPIGPFNEAEFSQALSREGLPPPNIDNSLNDLVRIPRYFQIWIRLGKQLQSLNDVTKEMVLWEDLLDKIKYTDPQILQKFDWQSAEDAQEILAKLAREAKWTDVDVPPQVPVERLKKDFPNYPEIRRDLEEQRIVLKAGKSQVELNENHIILGWALYLSKLFDCQEFTEIRNLSERFLQELEPIPEANRRADALFVALQITSIHPEDSGNDPPHKRAALMLAGFNSHNTRGTDKGLSLWAGRDPDAYAQVVEFEFERHNSPNYEETLIEPLANIWENKKGQIDRLASRLTKWLLPSDVDNITEVVDSVSSEEDSFPTMYYTRNRLLAAALSILSRRPERQFLETLARCYESSGGKAQFREDIERLMRWGYTEEVVGALYSLAEQAESDESLLEGVCSLVDSLRVDLSSLDLPPSLESLLKEKEKKRHAFSEERNLHFKSPIARIRDREKFLIGESPKANVKGNYYGLDYLAVRTDLPGLHNEDLVEIKKVLHYIAMNAKLGQSAGMTLADSCIDNLLPWIAKYDPESYAELACSLKLNALNQKLAQIELSSIQGLIFKPDDYEKITEAILGMKQHLAQGEDFYSSVEWLTSLLTEVLLFAAPKDKLTDWFEFLALHESLRKSIRYNTILMLLERLLPESIVVFAHQKLKELGPAKSDDQFPSDDGSKEVSERDYWSIIYAHGTQTDKDLVTWALEELKLREPDLTAGTFLLLHLASSDPKQFLDEILNSKEIRKHLFCKNSRRLIVPIYKGKDVPCYETLVPLVPPEIVGSFFCSPDRSDDLSRWGRELITRMCSILQGTAEDSNSVEERRFEANREALRTWAEQDTTNFRQLANEYLTQLSKFPRYSQELSDFTNNIRCLLLRFQPDKAKQYYHQWNSESFKTVYRTHYGVETSLAQLWKVEYCTSSEHRQLRRELLEECLNDEDIMFMTLAALSEGGRDELWSLVKDEYLESDYAKKRNLGVSILPWFGTNEGIEKLEGLKLNDSSQWVREHATWAYEAAQQERSCQEVYREALQTPDLFRISAVFEEIKPALSPTAQWWHRKIEKEELGEDPQDINTKLAALIDRFWYRWGNSTQTKRNIEIFGRKLREYCRGEKLSAGSPPRIAPWWKPTSDTED
ncbi:MAG: hypothetical protein OXI61_11500 [Candidatus Poribacteria bacterium]|nr:hypothetical protein [Candidatus Poribacteria bacterium]